MESTEEQRARAAAAIHARWAGKSRKERTEATAPATVAARASLDARLLAEVDPDGVLDQAERDFRLGHARKAHYASLAAASLRARRRAREELQAAEAAEAEIALMGQATT